MTRAAVPMTAATQSTSAPHERAAVQPMSPDTASSDKIGRPFGDLLRIALLAATALLLRTEHWDALGHPRIIGLAILLAGAYPIFREAFSHVIERRMTMELSMTIALVAALAIGEVVTALIIAAFVLVAEILENMAVSRGRNAIGRLVEYFPRRVRVRREGELTENALERLRDDDRVMVVPGGRIPVDGVVLGGESFVDQASITGEPMAVRKRPGTEVG